jgi:hypothetical protein
MNLAQQIETAASHLESRGRQAMQKEEAEAKIEATYATLVRNGGACSCSMLSLVTGTTRKTLLIYLNILMDRGLIVKKGSQNRPFYEVAPRAGLRTHQAEPGWLGDLEVMQ